MALGHQQVSASLGLPLRPIVHLATSAVGDHVVTEQVEIRATGQGGPLRLPRTSGKLLHLQLGTEALHPTCKFPIQTRVSSSPMLEAYSSNCREMHRLGASGTIWAGIRGTTQHPDIVRQSSCLTLNFNSIFCVLQPIYLPRFPGLSFQHFSKTLKKDSILLHASEMYQYFISLAFIYFLEYKELTPEQTKFL